MIIGGSLLTIDGLPQAFQGLEAIMPYDYYATGKLDLLLGGAALVALGTVITDVVSGNNAIARNLSKLIPGKSELNPGTLMAGLGLGACAFLGGGEVLQMMSDYGSEWTSHLLTDTAGYLKIASNAVPFVLASVIDYPPVYNRLQKCFSESQIRTAQAGLSAIGAAMIGGYGLDKGYGSAMTFGVAGTVGNLGAMISHQYNASSQAENAQTTDIANIANDASSAVTPATEQRRLGM